MPELSPKRERLPLPREPHSQRLAKRVALGFRRAPDTWVARYRGRDGKHQYKSLGESLEFDEAKLRAEAWLAQLAGSAVRSVKRPTVREAVEVYLADLRRPGRVDTARDFEGRFKTVLYEDILADLSVDPGMLGHRATGAARAARFGGGTDRQACRQAAYRKGLLRPGDGS